MPEETKQPQPEKLQVQDEPAVDGAPQAAPQSAFNSAIRPHRGTYRPSTKATFIGLAVVGLILAINIGVIAFVMRGQDESNTKINKETVTLSTESLSKLGVSKTAVDNAGTQLVVGPNSTFNGTVTMSSTVSVAGVVNINNSLIAADAKVSKLQADDVQLAQLNISGDGTAGSLSLRKDLTVVGSTRLQGTVAIAQLLTVNNNANIAGSLAVGGTLSVRNFQASSLTSDTTLTIGGHIITKGDRPSVVAGSGVGSNGTASISGNDASGTVAVNTGVGAGGGLLASVTFVRAYSSVPHVVVTAVGNPVLLYINRTANGFSIFASGALPPGGFAFDYIVMQ